MFTVLASLSLKCYYLEVSNTLTIKMCLGLIETHQKINLTQYWNNWEKEDILTKLLKCSNKLSNLTKQAE